MRTFPGLLGRGLIEADKLDDDKNLEGKPSPVYWAGASLKPVQFYEFFS